MRNRLLLVCFLAFSANLFAQRDTVFTNSEKIICTVKEVTPDAVKFIYPNEEIINTVFKNTVQKIVFQSGRVQTFAENTSYKTVNGPKDFESVSLTKVESEVRGLFKLGDVSSKAKGTTEFSNQERVKERAYRKLKIQAAMMRANIIYLTDARTQGNKWGSKYSSSETAEASFSGVAYTNTLPKYDEFVKTIGNGTRFIGIEMVMLKSGGSDVVFREASASLVINKVHNENGLIMIEGSLEGFKHNNIFRVTAFTNGSFIIVFEDKDTMYNFRFVL